MKRLILSGRSITKLRPLAEQYDLPWKILDLDQSYTLNELLRDVDVVWVVSGPFVNTARTLIEACIESKTHYLMSRVNCPVCRWRLRMKSRLKRLGLLLSPVAASVLCFTDRMAKHIVDRVGPLKSLQIALDVHSGKSAGTLACFRGGRLRSSELARITV